MTLNNLPFSHPYVSYNKNNMHNDEGEYSYMTFILFICTLLLLITTKGCRWEKIHTKSTSGYSKTRKSYETTQNLYTNPFWLIHNIY
jgi:hypothetical protein